MAANHLTAVWFRRLAGLVAVAGILALAGCGGGSGNPSNPNVAPPTTISNLVVLPTAATTYSGVPTVLTISGGLAPYRAFSSNGTVLPVSQTVAGNSVVLLASDVGADTPVIVTVSDASGQTAPSTITVKPATLLNTFTVTPNRTECGVSAVCSGQTATAAIVVQAPGGGTAPGRQVRFDVVSGPYSLVSANPALPGASSLTVVSDSAGVAQVVVRANVDAPTQPAQIRATDLTSGQQRTSLFLIVQNTNGSTILTVVPGTATIQSPFKNECSAGARVDYYIFGGTPPYRITPSFPDAITLVNTTVNTAGGFFEAITNGTCVSPLTFSVLDATGRQTTATLENLAGTTDRPTAPPPTPPSALTITPGSQQATNCNNTSFTFVVAGGTGPYNFNVSPATGVTGGSGQSSGTINFSITNPRTGGSAPGVTPVVPGTVTPQTYNVIVSDFSNPTKTANGTVTCN